MNTKEQASPELTDPREEFEDGHGRVTCGSIREVIGTIAMVFIALGLPWKVVKSSADAEELFNRMRDDQMACGKTETQAEYRTLLGEIMYLMTQTTPNVIMSNVISFAALSFFFQKGCLQPSTVFTMLNTLDASKRPDVKAHFHRSFLLDCPLWCSTTLT